MTTSKLTAPVVVLACTMAALGCVTTVSPHVVPAPVAVAPWGAEGEPFYHDLAPYGEWIHVAGPGWAWSPYDVPAGWQPYRLGHWVLTDYGWTWASDEEFGWVAYHYGRWHVDARYGWVWVPGTEWGPAWVAWNEGGGWVGWAPLPWQVRWSAGGGLDWGGLDIRVALGPSSWCFVSARHLVEPRIDGHIAPRERNITLIQNTAHVTSYTFIDNRIVNQSVKPEKIGRAVGHGIRRYQLEQADAPDAPRGGKVRDGKFVVYQPDAARGADVASPPVTSEPEPANRGPWAHPQRARKNSRPAPLHPQTPAPPAEASRDPVPAAPPALPKATESSPAPPAAPAPRAEGPAESKTPPGRTKKQAAPQAASKPGKPEAGKAHPKKADCDKVKPGDCEDDKKD